MKDLFLCFLLKGVIVLAVTFRTTIHFKLIFVYGVRWGSNFVVLHVAIHLSCTIC